MESCAVRRLRWVEVEVVDLGFRKVREEFLCGCQDFARLRLFEVSGYSREFFQSERSELGKRRSGLIREG